MRTRWAGRGPCRLLALTSSSNPNLGFPDVMGCLVRLEGAVNQGSAPVANGGEAREEKWYHGSRSPSLFSSPISHIYIHTFLLYIRRLVSRHLLVSCRLIASHCLLLSRRLLFTALIFSETSPVHHQLPKQIKSIISLPILQPPLRCCTLKSFPHDHTFPTPAPFACGHLALP